MNNSEGLCMGYLKIFNGCIILYETLLALCEKYVCITVFWKRVVYIVMLGEYMLEKGARQIYGMCTMFGL